MNKLNQKIQDFDGLPEYPTLQDVIYWIQNNLLPEDVFSSIDLESWANQSGFKRD